MYTFCHPSILETSFSVFNWNIFFHCHLAPGLGHKLITTLPWSGPGCCCPWCELGGGRSPVPMATAGSPASSLQSFLLYFILCHQVWSEDQEVWFSSLRGALCLSHRGIALHKCYLSKKDAVETRAVSGMEQMVLGFSTAAPWSVNGFTPCFFFFPQRLQSAG